MGEEQLKWPGNRIRATFLKFFEERGHKIVRSSSLVPTNDPTLLFTNAGMNQFKDVFLGLEHRDYNRATTCQKCVRAGGKHNDLENVGFTNRHHTFFEMLGNFSFGDYFKEQAIAYAWELVTSPEWFGIPKDKLYVTVFLGSGSGPGEDLIPNDEEAANFWKAQGVPNERIARLGQKENFWAMGDTGPCGPCSEIHYDMGPAASDQGHTDCAFPCDCGRYVEIWNLVFMQYNRDSGGNLNLLPKPSVDTGMGLERVAAVLQGKISNFDTDLFLPLIVQAGGMIRQEHTFADTPQSQASLRIIADHARATTFLISDGVLPSNEGRGYVLRKIMRRALRHVRLLGGNLYTLSNMSRNVAQQPQLNKAYPELERMLPTIQRVIRSEEEGFGRTVEVGLAKLDEDLEFEAYLADRAKLREKQKVVRVEPEKLVTWVSLGKTLEEITEAANRYSLSVPANAESFFPDSALPRFEKPTYPGANAFRLYDTYGLPRDFIDDVLRDQGIELDEAGFERAMQEQQQRSKASWKGAHKEAASPVYTKLANTFKTEPDFYFGTTTRDCHIEAIVAYGQQMGELKAGQEGEVVLDRTTIYSESGGQIADTGGLYDNDMSLQVAEVRGAYYPVAGLIAHRIVAKEDLVVGDRVATVADAARRARIMRNHTGTHLMNAALRNILGTHVKQAGSLNAPDHLRFDFSHFAQLAPEELQEIEQQVNEEILRDLPLHTDIMNIDDALASGALAFFGDKYPEQNVRVVTIDDAAYPRGFYSKELCGGTHVARTGEIGLLKIWHEQSVAAGVRRVMAFTGAAALADYRQKEELLRMIALKFDATNDHLLGKIEQLEQEKKQLEKQLEGLKRKSAVSMADSLLEGARTVKDVRVVAARVPGMDREALRQLADGLRQKMGSGVVFLAAGEPARDGGDGKVSIITAVTKDLTNRLHAGKMVQELAKFVGGSGGGRPDLAEAGGKDVAGIETAIAQVYPLVERML